MSSRDAVLEAVRAAQPEPLPDPEPAPAANAAAGPLLGRFRTALEAAGGRVAAPGTRVDALLAERFPGARVASAVPEVAGAVAPADVAEPHDLADVDVLVCRASLGVAENGAVWLTDAALGQRAAPFLAQHVVVLLSRGALVADLHEAYDALGGTDPGFGLFMAGPSKTADIEQSLVMGAHGPRSLTLLLIDEGTA